MSADCISICLSVRKIICGAKEAYKPQAVKTGLYEVDVKLSYLYEAYQ